MPLRSVSAPLRQQEQNRREELLSAVRRAEAGTWELEAPVALLPCAESVQAYTRELGRVVERLAARKVSSSPSRRAAVCHCCQPAPTRRTGRTARVLLTWDPALVHRYPHPSSATSPVAQFLPFSASSSSLPRPPRSSVIVLASCVPSRHCDPTYTAQLTASAYPHPPSTRAGNREPSSSRRQASPSSRLDLVPHGQPIRQIHPPGCILYLPPACP